MLVSRKTASKAHSQQEGDWPLTHLRKHLEDDSPSWCKKRAEMEPANEKLGWCSPSLADWRPAYSKCLVVIWSIFPWHSSGVGQIAPPAETQLPQGLLVGCGLLPLLFSPFLKLRFLLDFYNLNQLISNSNLLYVSVIISHPIIPSFLFYTHPFYLCIMLHMGGSVV